MIFLLMLANLTTAHGSPWHLVELGSGDSTEFFSGGAKTALVPDPSLHLDPVVVLIDHANLKSKFDRRDRLAWRREVIGFGPRLVVIKDHVEVIDGHPVYICHYQTARGGDRPEETLIRVSGDQNILILSFTNFGEVFRRNVSAVTDLYQDNPFSAVPKAGQ